MRALTPGGNLTESVRSAKTMALDWTEDELPFPLTAVDRAQLKLTDEEYEPHTWDQLRQIVGLLM